MLPDHSLPSGRRRWCVAQLAWLALLPVQAFASIEFEDASSFAGISRSGATYGAAWGDVNGDGLPDLWVGNHGAPTLYENIGGGRFVVANSRVQGLVPRDRHGAAWADFDGDGDQDLIEVCGSNQPNHLYVNEGGLLVDRASQLGVSLQGARSRTPLWVDWDLDGRLDLIVTAESGGSFPPVAMRNTGSGFVNDSARVGFSVSSAAFAVLGNLFGSARPELLVQDGPVIDFPGFVYDTSSPSGFVDVKAQLGLPPREWTASGDGIVEDFSGDLQPDLFVVKRTNNMQLALVGDLELRVRMNANADQKAIVFQSAGPVNLDLYPQFTATSGLVRIGSAGTPAASFSLVLDPTNPGVVGIPPYSPGSDDGIFVGYVPATEEWWIAISSPGSKGLDARVRSAQPITGAVPIGFPADPPGARPNFYVKAGAGFVERRTEAGLGGLMECNSAVAGDFDNDTDLDLYVVCSGLVVNSPNLLFENLGGGTFAQVLGAGGAAGAVSGKGDSVVSADYDGDGFLDLFVTNGFEGAPFNDGPLQLFQNRGNQNHWLEIDLLGTSSNPDSVGAQVTVTAGGVVQRRWQNGGVHRFSQNHQRVHFGLGPSNRVDLLEVTWPNGTQRTMRFVPADRIVTVSETVAGACGLGGEVLLPLAILAFLERRRRDRQPGPRAGPAPWLAQRGDR